MRELKFRAWDSGINVMIPWESLQQHSIPFLFGYGTLKLMQYTGLKDRNGNEIFEGDVIEVSLFSPHDKPFKGVVKWIDQLGGWYFDNGYNIGIAAPPNSAEVIGNIYDNPELLEATT